MPTKLSIPKERLPASTLLFAVLLLIHTICFLIFDGYTLNLYAMAATCVSSLGFFCLFEKTQPKLMIMGCNLICGLYAPLAFIITPEFAFFSYAVHYLGFMFLIFLESADYAVHILLGCNTTGWMVCLSYYFLEMNHGSSLPLQIQYLIGNYNSLGQMMLGVFISYIGIFMLDKEKRRLTDLRTRHEADSIRLNEDLKNSYGALETTNKILKETLAERESFILRFSHEIRNPLNSLLGNVELCCEAVTKREEHEMLRDAKISGETLLLMLNNILDSAKIPARRVEIDIKCHNLRNFLENLWLICSDILKRFKLFGFLGVGFNVPVWLEFDELRLKQIIMNLFNNSVNFTQNGFVKIFVDFVEKNAIMSSDLKPKYVGLTSQESNQLMTTSNFEEFSLNEYSYDKHDKLTIDSVKFQPINLNLPQEEEEKINEKIQFQESRSLKLIGRGSSSPLKIQSLTRSRHSDIVESASVPTTKTGFLRFEIIDSGAGIIQKTLKNIFKNSLHRGNESSDRQIGAGLGLWITKELVELMGGKIEIYSKLNVGTCLVFLLKTKSTKPSKSLRLNSPLLANEKHMRRVLIVEDIIYNQEVNRRLLLKCGINQISVTSNGLEALELYKLKGERYFSLILTDLDMPIMNGKTSIKLIREHERKLGWKATKIVVLTGYAESSTQQELLNPTGLYRANAFLSKPCSFEMLMRTLKDLQ